MTLSVPLAAVLGLGTAVGLVLCGAGLVGTTVEPADLDAKVASRFTSARARVDRGRLAVSVGVGVVVAVVTRWPVAAALSALAAYTLPTLIGPDRGHERRVARVEAIATWAEALRDNLSAAAGLEQAITVTAADAPQPIRDEVTRLAVRIQRGWRLPSALRALAGELADPTADLVVAGLLMAARGAAGQLAEVLGELAASARAKVASRQRIAAARRRNRTSARVIVAATLAMAGGLTLLNRGYLRPFDSVEGQLVLLAVGGCFGGAFWWLARLMRDRDGARVLEGVATPEPEAVEVGP